MKPALLAVAVAAAAVSLAPPAHASEATYLTMIAVDYNFPVVNEAEALRAGYEICAKLRNGIPRERVAGAMYWNMAELTAEQAHGIAYSAQRELCPDTAQ